MKVEVSWGHCLFPFGSKCQLLLEEISAELVKCQAADAWQQLRVPKNIVPLEVSLLVFRQPLALHNMSKSVSDSSDDFEYVETPAAATPVPPAEDCGVRTTAVPTIQTSIA